MNGPLFRYFLEDQNTIYIKHDFDLIAMKRFMLSYLVRDVHIFEWLGNMTELTKAHSFFPEDYDQKHPQAVWINLLWLKDVSDDLLTIVLKHELGHIIGLQHEAKRFRTGTLFLVSEASIFQLCVPTHISTSTCLHANQLQLVALIKKEYYVT